MLRVILGGLSALLMLWAAVMLDKVSPGSVLAGFLVGYFWPSLWLRDRVLARQKNVVRTLPFFLTS